MGDIWLIRCRDERYRQIREEIKGRYGAQHIIRLCDADQVPALARGLANACVRVVLDVDTGAEGIARAERSLRELAQEPCVAEQIACVRVLDAGMAARCFSAGATEVIAVGDVETPTEQYVGAHVKEGGHAPCAEYASTRDAPACDGCESYAYDEADEREIPWEELPPWDESAGEARDETRGEPSADVTGSWGRVERETRPGAPVITVISGRGGTGKTTLVTAMATYAAHIGLRAAVLDLDLMFGNAWELMGVEGFRGIEDVGLHADEGGLAEQDIEAAAMRIGPGLTLWGPCAGPEYAERCAPSIECLVEMLRDVADVIFVDTSEHWGDAVAMAVSRCDRCLVVGGPGASASSSGARAVELASQLGVPHTRMACVFNRLGARGCDEGQALAFEMGTALHSHLRIADGGEEVTSMLSFGQMDKLMTGSSAFAQSVRSCTTAMLQELGCPVEQWIIEEERRRMDEGDRPRLRLPWKQRASDVL